MAFVPPTATPWDLLYFEWALNSLEDHLAERVDWEYREKEKEVVISYLH